MTLPMYVDKMVNGSEYATVCEIQATCTFLGTNITVWLKQAGSTPQRGPAQQTGSTPQGGTAQQASSTPQAGTAQ